MIQEIDKINDLKIRDFVNKNIKAAKILEKAGIDFCCGGNRLLKEVCEEEGVDYQSILTEIDKSAEETNNNNYDLWELDFLIDFIINNHHTYVKQTLPEIRQHLEQVVYKHGEKYSYLKQVSSHFDLVEAELLSHMQKEENILFPLIKKIVEQSRQSTNTPSQRMSVINPIVVMEQEHENAGNAFNSINKLTNFYTAPTEACNTFKLVYDELKEFEEDLHLHIHLENNILFPKAVELEKELELINN